MRVWNYAFSESLELHWSLCEVVDVPKGNDPWEDISSIHPTLKLWERKLGKLNLREPNQHVYQTTRWGLGKSAVSRRSFQRVLGWWKHTVLGFYDWTTPESIPCKTFC